MTRYTFRTPTISRYLSANTFLSRFRTRTVYSLSSYCFHHRSYKYSTETDISPSVASASASASARINSSASTEIKTESETDAMVAPDLPHPAHIDHDSALGRKFGKEVVNYFGSSPLNRLSFFRDDNSFLHGAYTHPSARFMIFNNLSPLIKSPTEIHYVTKDELAGIVPEEPYVKNEKEMIEAFDSNVVVPGMVFLGLDEKVKEGGYTFRNYTGAPYFAVDVTPKGGYEGTAKDLTERLKGQGLSFVEGMRAMSFPPDVAAAYAQGRHYLDWNSRNTYCGTCGHKTLSVNGGTKRVCPPKDKADGGERPPCSTRTTLSNLTFPRTDPTIIVAVLSHDSKRLLLGRQKRWPPYWFSTLAGFVEPAESVEDAVRREVWEESGVVLSRVLVHSTQPWPYPANLMIGAIAQVAREEDEVIKLDNDPELETAKWFTLDEISEALENGTSNLGDAAPSNYKEGNLRLPPRTAIAHQLISAVVTGGFLEGVTPLATASRI